jgi:hypothetical protein
MMASIFFMRSLHLPSNPERRPLPRPPRAIKQAACQRFQHLQTEAPAVILYLQGNIISEQSLNLPIISATAY